MPDVMMDSTPKSASPSRRSPPVYAVIRSIRPLFRHLLKSVENNLEGSGISVPMRGMMERLFEAGPQTVPQLAQALLIPRQFAQQVANELRDAGLVEHAVNRAHKRSRLIRLRPKGQASFEHVRTREMAVIKRAARGLSVEDIEGCLRVLAHLTERFEEVAAQGEPITARSASS